MFICRYVLVGVILLCVRDDDDDGLEMSRFKKINGEQYFYSCEACVLLKGCSRSAIFAW